jgi:preprotein translocase subunit YajC
VDNQQITILVVGLILLSAFMFLPQWQTRRRRQKQMASLHVGDEIMTVGGIIGKLTVLNTDEERAHIEVAPGVEIQIVLTAISRTLTQASNPDQPAE